MFRISSKFVAIGAAAALAAPIALAAPDADAATHHGGPSKGRGLPYQNHRLPVRARVADLLSRMTLAEKVGQMTQGERASVDADTSQITTDKLGSVLSGAGSVPTPNTPESWADTVDRYQSAALATRCTSR